MIALSSCEAELTAVVKCSCETTGISRRSSGRFVGSTWEWLAEREQVKLDTSECDSFGCTKRLKAENCDTAQSKEPKTLQT